MEWGEGGSRQIILSGKDRFILALTFDIQDGHRTVRAFYRIDVEVREPGLAPHLKREKLSLPGRQSGYVFDTHPDGDPLGVQDSLHIAARVRKIGRGAPRNVQFLSVQPILSQLPAHPATPDWAARMATNAMQTLASMRFLDLAPEAARQPSQAGLTTLGDRGENLSSVLQEISRDERSGKELAGWVNQLTPADVTSLDFETDASGRVLAILVENGGRRTPLTTASDGTIRFLATVAALTGPDRARFAFFEELENGIHPNRLHLLLELIGRSVGSGDTQVVATTHSPYLLVQLDRKQQQFASLAFRAPNGLGKIFQITEMPEARKVLEKHDVAQLMAAGWFEDVAEFAQEDGSKDPGVAVAGA